MFEVRRGFLACLCRLGLCAVNGEPTQYHDDASLHLAVLSSQLQLGRGSATFRYSRL